MQKYPVFYEANFSVRDPIKKLMGLKLNNINNNIKCE
jgi:hypothetical protein